MQMINSIPQKTKRKTPVQWFLDFKKLEIIEKVILQFQMTDDNAIRAIFLERKVRREVILR